MIAIAWGLRVAGVWIVRLPGGSWGVAVTFARAREMAEGR